MISACKGTSCARNAEASLTDPQTTTLCCATVSLVIGTLRIHLTSRHADNCRIGTFFKHKGAAYQARLSADAATAATASSDFTAYAFLFRAL
jgi:hypothetical protein